MKRKINLGPIRHKVLADDLLRKIRKVHQIIGKYLGITLEQFEVGFMREINPTREVSIWCRIALAWRKYHVVYTEGKTGSIEEEQLIIGYLLSMSANLAIVAPAEQIRKLIACFNDPILKGNDDDSYR